MSLWILQPDPNGNCCDCNGRASPCDSCSTDCCFDVPYAFSSAEQLQAFIETDMGGLNPPETVGCNSYARRTDSSSSRSFFYQETYTDTIRVSTVSASSSSTLAYSDSIVIAFTASGNQNIRVAGTSTITPNGPAPFYGWEAFILSGATALDSRAGYGDGSFDFEFVPSANGCFRLLFSTTNGFISPAQIASANLSAIVQSPTAITPMPVRLQYNGEYYAPSGCSICGTGSESLP